MSDVTVRSRRHAAVWNAGLPVRVAPAALTRRPLLLVCERLADPEGRLLAVLRRAADPAALRVCQSVLVAPEKHGGTCVGILLSLFDKDVEKIQWYGVGFLGEKGRTKVFAPTTKFL